MTKKTTKKAAKKAQPTKKQIITQNAKALADIVNEKQRGAVIVVKKTKGGIETSVMSHEFTFGDVHLLCEFLISQTTMTPQTLAEGIEQALREIGARK